MVSSGGSMLELALGPSIGATIGINVRPITSTISSV